MDNDTEVDSSGNGNTGTLNHLSNAGGGSVTKGAAGPIIGDSSSKAWSWPAARSNCWGVTLPGAINTSVNSQTFTVEMWAQYDAINGWTGYDSLLMRMPVGVGGTGGLYANLPTSTGPGSFSAGNGASFAGVSPDPYTKAIASVQWAGGVGHAGDWHQVAATHVPGAWIVYVDGVVAGISPSVQWHDVGGGVTIGRYHLTDSGCGSVPLPWAGNIAEVAIYPTALQPSTIANHYVASGRSLPGGVSPQELYGGGNLSEKCVQCFAAKYVNQTKNPVDASTGNFWHTFTDIRVPGRGPALDLAQTYNSLDATTNGPLGYGWSFSYGMHLNVGTGGSPPVTVVQENGSQVTFTANGAGYGAPSRVQATLVHNGDGSWTFVRQKRSTFQFDSSGQLTSIADSNGYATNLAYSGGKLSSVTDPAGRSLTFAYSGALISSVTDTAASPNRTVTFGYDGSGNLTSITDVNGGITTMGYDGAHQLTSMLDPRQQGSSTNTLTNTYDASSHKVTAQTDFQTRTTQFDYSTPGQTTITDPKGNATVESFMGGLPAAVTKDPTGVNATWRFVLDPATSMPTGVLDPNGNLAKFSVDADGNTLTATQGINALAAGPVFGGRTSSFTYDTAHHDELLSSQDPVQAAAGVSTSYTYDTNGNLVSKTSPLVGAGSNQVTTFTYGDGSHPGDVTSMTDPNGKVWSYTYDSAGDLSSVTDPVTPSAHTTTFCYDSIGRQVKVISPKGTAAAQTCATATPTFTDTYTYNAFGQVLTDTNAMNQSQVFTYDKNGNVKTAKDANNNTTSYDYNFDSQVTVVHRPDSTTLQSDYWPDGSLKSQTDGAGAVTNYTYDTLGNLASVSDPKGRTTSYTNDALGNVKTKTDPGGTCPATACTAFGYDTFNQLVNVAYSDPDTPNVAYTYDGDGQRTAMTETLGGSQVNATTWSWDSLHRVTQQVTNQGSAETTGYHYDLANNLTSIDYPGTGHTVTRAYDEAHRLISTTDWASRTTTFSYDANGNQTGQNVPSAAPLIDAYSYNDANQQAATTVGTTSAPTSLANIAYQRDNQGQLTSQTTGLTGAADSFGYNTLNQLTQKNSTSTWTADAADNLTTIPTSGGANRQVFDNANQLCFTAPTGVTGGSCATPPTGTGTNTYSYDIKGNRTQVTTAGTTLPTNYGYDQANRLTSVAQPTAGNQGGYVPLPPARILDTRVPTGTCYSPSPCSTIPAGGTLTLQVTGQGGVPTTGVSAVVVNVTAASPTSIGNLIMWANGDTKPLASNLNFAGGQTVSDLAIVKVGTSGRIKIFSNARTDVVVDVQGYYVTANGNAGGYFNPVNPARILDTRVPTGTCDGGCHKLVGGTPLTIQVAGQGGLPATGVSSVAINVTVTNSDGAGWLVAWASTDSMPTNSSNLNWSAGDVRALLLVTKVGSDGKIKIQSTIGTHLVIDVQGWYSTSGNGFTPANPARVLDTRTAYQTGNCPANPAQCTTLGAGATRTVQIAGQGGVPTNATVVALTVTAVNPSAASFFIIYPADQSQPATSNLNFLAGQNTNNVVFAPLSANGQIKLYNVAGNVDATLDVLGYYSNPTSTSTYKYNGDGVRRQKGNADGTTTNYSWTPGATNAALLAETTGSNVTYTIYGPGGAPVEQIRPDGTPIWLHHDQLGSTRLVTDNSGANIATYTYDAYGRTTATTGNATATSLQYAGQYTDPETGLQYLHARYYDPATAQFLTRDPLNTLTRSAYGYVNNNPLNNTDPSGLFLGISFDDALMGTSLVGLVAVGACAAFWEVCLPAVGAASALGAGLFASAEAAEVCENSAADSGADFVAGPIGSEPPVPVSQSRMAAGFDEAGFPSTPTASPGTEYTLPDGTKVRLMEASGDAPMRASFTNANGGPINPFTGKPVQPPAPSGWSMKDWVRAQTHVEQMP